MFAKGTERESVVANTVLRGLKKINCHLTASEEYQRSLMGGSGKLTPFPSGGNNHQSLTNALMLC